MTCATDPIEPEEQHQTRIARMRARCQPSHEGERSVRLPWPPLTAERLREVLDYDQAAGVFRWKDSGPRTRKAKGRTGKIAGCLNAYGYRVIRVDRRLYFAGRLAWLWMHGRWPTEEVDHINGDQADDRLSNLREANRTQQVANTGISKRNTSGHKGIRWHPRNRVWEARLAGKYVGASENKRAAAALYRQAAIQVHGNFVRQQS